MSQPQTWACNQGKGLQECGTKGNSDMHILYSWECMRVWRMNPHTPKWVPTKGVGVSMDS
jgi:hypothetical protein